jgi:hypothetical protein
MERRLLTNNYVPLSQRLRFEQGLFDTYTNPPKPKKLKLEGTILRIGDSMKREIDLTPYIQPIMELAEKTNERDYLMLRLIGEGAGFRRGEVVGNKDRREVWPIDAFPNAKKKSEKAHRVAILDRLYQGETVKDDSGEYSLIRDGSCVLRMRPDNPLPGLQVQDLHDGSIWVRGKGGTEREQPLSKALYERIQRFIGKRKTGPIFDFSADGLYKLTKKYARAAGVGEWNKVHPHRFRHAYIRAVYRQTKDPVMTQRLARHATFDMTNHYIGEPDMSDKKKVIEELHIGR